MKPDQFISVVFVLASVAIAVVGLPALFEDPPPDSASFQPAAMGPGGGPIVTGPPSFLESKAWDDPLPLPQPSNGPVDPGNPPLVVEIPAELRESVAEFESIARDAETRTSRLREIAREWAESDPVCGILWSIGLDTGDGHLALLEILRQGHQGSNDFAPAAFESLARTPGGSPRNRRLAESLLLQAWAQADPESAWAHIGDGENVAQIETVLSTWVETDPQAVASRLSQLTHLPDPESTAMLAPIYGLAVRGLAETDPASAVQWAADLPDDKARAAATGSLVRSWLRQDPEAASRWLDGQAAGRVKDAGITSLVLAFRHSDPEAARLWAETISPENARLRQNLLAQWESEDEPADSD